MAQKYLPTGRSKQIASFLEKAQAARGRLVFCLDATASRQPTWDHACQLQSEMFTEAAKIGVLEIQLVYYRGLEEFRHSGWTTNAHELANQMSRITCLTGETQIARVLAHIRGEHARKPIGAAIFVGDCVEEERGVLYDAATGLPPLFLFQEGADPKAGLVFGELARLTRGAFVRLDSGAARELAELLRAVAAFAAGGMRALTDLRTEGARRLLTQLK